jgi:hypothetical protein
VHKTKRKQQCEEEADETAVGNFSVFSSCLRAPLCSIMTVTLFFGREERRDGERGTRKAANWKEHEEVSETKTRRNVYGNSRQHIANPSKKLKHIRVMQAEHHESMEARVRRDAELFFVDSFVVA